MGLESDPVSKESGIRLSLKKVWNQTQSQKGLESDPVSKKSGPVSERFGSSFDSQAFFPALDRNGTKGRTVVGRV